MHRDLTQGDISVHIRHLAIPASIGFFFHTMFNVTDTYFAGMISTQALAALTLSFPIFFMIIAIAGGMSEGVTALVGNALGEGNKAHAKHIINNVFFYALILSLTLSLVGWLSAPFLMKQLGASGEYLEVSLAYINIVIASVLFFVFTFFINALLNAIGDTKAFRNALILGFIINIFLDYWFVKGGLGIEPMGVEGIALATVLIELLTMLYLLFRLRSGSLLKNRPPFKLDSKVFKAFLAQGTPPTLNLLLMSFGIYVITYFIAPFGQDAVAAYGVGMRIEQIALMPSIGLSVAVLSMVSQNNGAKAYERIDIAMRVSRFYAFILAGLGMIILLLFAKPMMLFFTPDEAVVEAGVLYVQISAFALLGYILIFLYLALLQGIKRP
ncbi:MAG: MATE family efflux transporter, partial [Thiovulaceae bacterium]|nr:MATE family efflux transporter [Sulfurimonadaceae bacterium]